MDNFFLAMPVSIFSWLVLLHSIFPWGLRSTQGLNFLLIHSFICFNLHSLQFGGLCRFCQSRLLIKILFKCLFRSHKWFWVQFVSLVNPAISVDMGILRDCYESFAMYCFGRYLVACLGMMTKLPSYRSNYCAIPKYAFDVTKYFSDSTCLTSLFSLNFLFVLLFISAVHSSSRFRGACIN